MTKLSKILFSTVAVLAALLPGACSEHVNYSGLFPGETEKLLSELDSLLARTPEFTRRKEEHLAGLRRAYLNATDDERRFWLASDIYDEYCAYDSDSAMAYANIAHELAGHLGRPHLVDEMELNRSYLYSATGLFDEAAESLAKINTDSLSPELMLRYCDRMLFLSTHRDQYIGVERVTEMYSQKTDSMLRAVSRHITPESPSYCWMLGWRSLGTQEDTRRAIPEVSRRVDSTGYDTRANAMDAWVLSKMYDRVGDEDNRLKYLLLSAMADVRASNKEIASLEEVAAIMLDRGDLEHANSYINFCIAYANDYKSRVRIGRLAEIQKKTLSSIHERISRQAAANRIYLAVLCVFLAVLTGAIFRILRQNRQLHNSRRTLNEANRELSDRVEELQNTREELKLANSRLSEMYETARTSARELAEVNESKEAYIANIFTICSNYINKHEDFRANLYKLLKERKFEEALRIVKSPELSYGEVKELYANFDAIFLKIYPDFVNDFNRLLRPEERVELKDPAKLTTELRIYALVRLGLNDSVKIARFLHCSVQTVYNTRQRTRNKALVPREEFAAAVKALGKPSF